MPPILLRRRLGAQDEGACYLQDSDRSGDRRIAASDRSGELRRARRKAMRRFIIEREIPAIGAADREAMKAAAQKSNGVLKELGPDIQWVQSFVTGDKIFCVYLAKDEALIRRHAELSGFPANKITEVKRTIDPTTALAG
jgi:hypothetical protein